MLILMVPPSGAVGRDLQQTDLGEYAGFVRHGRVDRRDHFFGELAPEHKTGAGGISLEEDG